MLHHGSAKSNFFDRDQVCRNAQEDFFELETSVEGNLSRHQLTLLGTHRLVDSAHMDLTSELFSSFFLSESHFAERAQRAMTNPIRTPLFQGATCWTPWSCSSFCFDSLSS